MKKFVFFAVLSLGLLSSFSATPRMQDNKGRIKYNMMIVDLMIKPEKE